ncbi:biotin synthase BioB [Aquirhabdus parva]|jgi:biotin synthase|uniref:Biotin synthase n=1 Tax=Aquirhabdus parva TaxID=2283318 RepID=A0A345P835_9GAMM|nr:biotin synthase BioB [Aquirhabdus parva]AXI03444.1 biotin synthase BioB [Aquirhabdus parva]
MMLRNDWTRDEIAALFDLPFNDLMFQAQTVHRQHFDANAIQVSTLLSIKTGNCPEDCDYCSQSAHHQTALVPEKKIAIEKVLEAAKAARDTGASRFCMGAAWRNPHERDMPYVLELVKEVKAMGLETCMTLGMLSSNQAERLAEAGLDYYNHNLDTSREHYAHIIRTRTFDDRLDTLSHVRASGMKVCSGGIVGLGESRQDRVGLLHELSTLPLHPESVPLNLLVAVEGTPLGDTPQLPVIEWIKTIAVARILMPKSYVRLSAGREGLTDSEQALAFLAGANSLFYGEKLLTTPNADSSRDDRLFETLGLHREAPRVDVKLTALDAMSA